MCLERHNNNYYFIIRGDKNFLESKFSLKYAIEKIKKTFPFIENDLINNSRYKKALSIHESIFQKLLSGENPTYEMIDECILNYSLARDEGIIEANVNLLSIIAFISTTITSITPEALIEGDDYIKKNNLTIKDVFSISLEGTPDPDDKKSWQEAYREYDEYKAEILNKIEEWLPEYYKSVEILKQTRELYDLADYYLASAFKFNWGFFDTTKANGYDTYTAMILSLYYIGNEYAKQVLEDET